MRLQSGSRLGPYEIMATIGAGGMGEVYRAADTNLKRHVAIKVLPDAVAGDEERLVRFQREAEVLALLNHPNISQIYGLERSNGVTALVMELVEGPTLADRISHGAIPLPDALPIAKQIAEALEAAHDLGIVHRDLKPANIKIRPEGTVKVLDFGLAKAGAAGADGHAVQLMNAPTVSSPEIATTPGVILGTAAYMAPEQAKGRPADRRADMWAFGCVLYEMLTGQPAFSGENVTEVLAAVVRDEPDCSGLPKATPPAIETLIRRCLKKDPRQRLADASAARLDLDDALTGRAGASEDEPRGRRRRHAPFAVPLLIGVTLLAGSILGWTLRPQTPPSSGIPARLEISLPPGDQLDLFYNNVALSPDGRTVAYVASHEGVSRLYVRPLDSFEVSPLAGTDGAFHPFFSPDARWLGFFAQGKMKKIRVGGGAVQAIVDAGPNGGASWGADGTIVYAPSAITGKAGLARVSDEGGEPTVVTTPDVAKGEYNHRYPQILPGGRAVLFTSLSGFGWDESRVEAVRLDTGERRLLVRGGHTGRYVPGGHLLYYRAGAIYAVRFDPDRLEVYGESPVAIADDALGNSGIVGAPLAISDKGSVAYVPAPAGRRQLERRLMWTDRQGRLEPLGAPVRNYSDRPVVSPDGRRVAVVIVSGTAELWVYDLARASLTPLTSDRSSSADPVWTPDSRRLAYRNNQTGSWSLYQRTVDGSEPEEPLTTGQVNETPWSWSPNGRVLAFERWSSATGRDIYTLSLDGDRKPRPFLASPAREGAPQFSPDGRWVAYVSDESGGFQVYVAPYPGPGRRWQISMDGGDAPQWNPKGGELFYENGPQTMVVNVKTGTTFNAGKPRVLYVGPLGRVAPDGQRFLTNVGVVPSQPPRTIRMILTGGNELNGGSRN
jgi:serine/threonine protein kinase